MSRPASAHFARTAIPDDEGGWSLFPRMVPVWVALLLLLIGLNLGAAAVILEGRFSDQRALRAQAAANHAPGSAAQPAAPLPEPSR